jgi:hypothetical protein
MKLSYLLGIGSVWTSTLVVSTFGESDPVTDNSSTVPSSLVFAVCNDTLVTNIITTDSALAFIVEQHYEANKPNSIIVSIENTDSLGMMLLWQQVSRPSLELAAVNSPILAFTPISNDN